MITAPYIGMPVLYRLRHGQVRAGQNELAAIVTRIHGERQVKVEQPQEFKRIQKVREAAGKIVEKEVTEQRMVDGVATAPASVDLTIFVPNSDPLHYENIQAMSDTVTGHCWRPVVSPEFGIVKVHQHVAELEQVRGELDKARADIRELSDQVRELAEMVTAPQRPKVKEKAMA